MSTMYKVFGRTLMDYGQRSQMQLPINIYWQLVLLPVLSVIQLLHQGGSSKAMHIRYWMLKK